MPITDNSFTPEELESAIKATPDLINHVTGFLQKKEYSVFDKSSAEAYKSTISKESVSDYEKTLSEDIDKFVFETTKVEKLPAESFKDYTKRVLADRAKVASELSDEIKTLKSKSNITDAEKEQLAELIKIRDTQKAEIDTLKSNHASEITNMKSFAEISSAASRVTPKFVKNELVQEAIQIKSEKEISDMQKSSKYEGDKLVFVGKDGKVLMNQDGSFKTAEQIYQERMSSFIDKGKTQGGAGAKGEEGGTTLPGTVTTQVQLTRMLQKEGLVSGTQEFTDKFNAYGGKTLPVN